mgnify:FL=1
MKKWLCLVSMLIICLAICNVSFAATTLKDIKGTKYESAVENLIEVGLVNGYPEDNTYRPNVVVTRAQMAKMMVVALGEEGKVTSAATKKSTFTDIKNGHWAYGYVNVAKDLGIINGYPDGRFGPDETVTYAEATTMAIRALGYDNEVGKSTEIWPNNYTSYAKKLDLYDGMGTFTANKGAARGDVAIVLWNMLRTGVCTVVGQSGNTLKYGQGQRMISKYKNYTYLKDATVTSVKFDDNYSKATVKIADDKDSLSLSMTSAEVLKYYGRKLEVMYKNSTKKLCSITDQKAYKVKSGSITKVTSKKIEIDDDEYTLPSKSDILLYKVDSLSEAIDATLILDGSTVKYVIASGAREIKIGFVDEVDVKISKKVYGMKVKVAGSSRVTTYELINEKDMPKEGSVIIYYVNSKDQVGIIKELTEDNASSIGSLTSKKIKIGKTTYTYDADTFTVLNVGTSSIKNLSFTKIDEDNDLVYVYENAGQTYLIVFEDSANNKTESNKIKKDLESYIKNVDGKKEASYSQATYMKYYNALETAKTLVKSSSATNKKLQQALTDLKEAVSGLRTVTSYSAEGKIAKARSDLRGLVNGKAATIVSDKAKYTSASYSAFEKKLKTANTLLSEDDTTETEVKNAYNALNDAITNGMVLEANTQEHKDAVKLLEDALSKADGKTESDYTVASWKTFKTARDKATTIKTNPSAYTAINIKEAATALISAIDNLKSAADTELNKLNALIADCVRDVEDSNYYIESTYSGYEKALQAALQVDSGDSVEVIKKATKDLTSAKNSLVTVKSVFDALKSWVGGKVSDTVDSALKVEDKPEAQMSAIETASNRMTDAMEGLINEARGYVSTESGESFDKIIKLIDNANDSEKEFKSVVNKKDYTAYIKKSNNVLDNFVKSYSELKNFIDDLSK